MRRRELIAGLGGATVAWPLAARAQQPAMPVIGFLSARSADDDYKYTVPFFQGLKETGYVEGQNVAVEFRWAGGQYDRVPTMAAELVRRQVAVSGLRNRATIALNKHFSSQRVSSRFSSPFIFRLLQQYRPDPDMPPAASGGRLRVNTDSGAVYRR